MKHHIINEKEYIINEQGHIIIKKEDIINSFIKTELNTFDNILIYICYYNIENNNLKKDIKIFIQKNIKKLIKEKSLIKNNKYFLLTNKGKIILNDNIRYYSYIIYFFLKKYTKKNKKFILKEIREEQSKLRKYLIQNRINKCILCDKFLPLCLLETAHLKPRCLLNFNDKNDLNCVEFMCKYCHNLYDNGYLSVNNGILNISFYLINNKFDLNYENYKDITYYNSENNKYFDFHFDYIFIK